MRCTLLGLRHVGLPQAKIFMPVYVREQSTTECMPPSGQDTAAKGDNMFAHRSVFEETTSRTIYCHDTPNTLIVQKKSQHYYPLWTSHVVH